MANKALEASLISLPLWARAAFAIRCARRSQPLLLLADDARVHETYRTTEKVLVRAEVACATGRLDKIKDLAPLTALSNDLAALKERQSRYGRSKDPHSAIGFDAVGAVVDAGYATLIAWQALDTPDREASVSPLEQSESLRRVLDAYAQFSNAIELAIFSAAKRQETRDELLSLMRAADTDRVRLHAFSLGRGDTIGQRIDHTEEGPLGILWPTGIPSLYQELGTPSGALYRVAPDPLQLLIDPGSASAEELSDLFYELSALYRKLGGSGLRFDVTDCRQPSFVEVDR